MKEFRTELTPVVSADKISLKDQIFTIGSCFADEIGHRLSENKFSVWSNRFGTVYNPVSIHRLLWYGIENKFPFAPTYLEREGIFLNYDFHSSVSALSKSDLEQKIKNLIGDANQFLKSANTIVITYGTAFIYRLKSSGEMVANCHKQSSSLFEKQLLKEKEIVESFQSFHSRLTQLNPKAKVIITVSPVRHLKDTFELNAVSKSILRTACHAIVNQFSNVQYFPSFEIMMDDLRDYRFYKTDRIHPTEEAVDYIWEKFSATYFDEATKRFITEWQHIKNDLAHQPFHLESETHQKFLKSLLNKLEQIQAKADVCFEIETIKSKIVNRKS